MSDFFLYYKGLTSQNVVFMLIDMYYISLSNHFEKDHFYHELMIYGYDTENGLLNIESL